MNALSLAKGQVFFFFLFPVLFLKEQDNYFTDVRTCSTSRCYYHRKPISFILPLTQEMLRLHGAQTVFPWLCGPSNITAVLKSPSQNTISALILSCNVQNKIYPELENPTTSDCSLNNKTIIVHGRKKGVGSRYKLICPQESGCTRLSNRTAALTKHN